MKAIATGVPGDYSSNMNIKYHRWVIDSLWGVGLSNAGCRLSTTGGQASHTAGRPVALMGVCGEAWNSHVIDLTPVGSRADLAGGLTPPVTGAREGG
jgi:hypothetical protein